MLIIPSPMIGAQEATPITDTSPSPSGTITIHSVHDASGLQFQVSNHRGEILESGLLEGNHHHSPHLVSAPGSIAYLILLDASGNFVVESETIADSNGALHFVIELSSMPEPQRISGEIQSGETRATRSSETVEFRLHVNARTTATGLPNHQVHLIFDGEVIQTAITDEAGNSTFTVQPGTYSVRVDPYGLYPGTAVETVVINEATDHYQITLAHYQNNGRLTVKTMRVRHDMPVVSIINANGVVIAQETLEGSTAGVTFRIPHSDNYTIRISGNEEWEPATLSGIRFQSNSRNEILDTRPRSKADLLISVTVPPDQTAPQRVQATLSVPDWEQHFTIDNVDGILRLPIRFVTGAVEYRVSAPGYVDAIGVFNHHAGVRGLLELELTPEPKPVETPDVTPSETPIETPEVTPSETPVETPDVTPSETPVETPQVTPSETPVETPEVTPSKTPVETPEVTPSETPAETPDVTPSETPMETPAQTPDVTATLTPTPDVSLDDASPSGVVIVRFSLLGGETVAGAPYSIYAPVASQFMAEPYHRGFVSADNAITILNLVPDTYRIVVERENMPPIDFRLEVGNQNLTEALVVIDESGNIAVSYSASATPPPVTPNPIAPVSADDQPPGQNPPITANGNDSNVTQIITELPESGNGPRLHNLPWSPQLLFVFGFMLTFTILVKVTIWDRNQR